LGKGAFLLELGGLVPVACAAATHMRVIRGLLRGRLSGRASGRGCAIRFYILLFGLAIYLEYAARRALTSDSFLLSSFACKMFPAPPRP
jgi:hypothetical protein